MFANFLVEDTWKRASHLKFLKDLARVRRLRLRRLTKRIKYDMKIDTITSILEEKIKVRNELMRQSMRDLRRVKRLSRKLIRLRRRRRWRRYRRIRRKLHQLRIVYANGLAYLEKLKLQMAKLKKMRMKYKRIHRSIRIPRLPKYRPRQQEPHEKPPVVKSPTKESKKPTRRLQHPKRTKKHPATQPKKEPTIVLPPKMPIKLRRPHKTQVRHTKKPRKHQAARSGSPDLSGDFRSLGHKKKLSRKSPKRKRRPTPSKEQSQELVEHSKLEKSKKPQISRALKKLRKNGMPLDSLVVAAIRKKRQSKKMIGGKKKPKQSIQSVFNVEEPKPEPEPEPQTRKSTNRRASSKRLSRRGKQAMEVLFVEPTPKRPSRRCKRRASRKPRESHMEKEIVTREPEPEKQIEKTIADNAMVPRKRKPTSEIRVTNYDTFVEHPKEEKHFHTPMRKYKLHEKPKDATITKTQSRDKAKTKDDRPEVTPTKTVEAKETPTPGEKLKKDIVKKPPKLPGEKVTNEVEKHAPLDAKKGKLTEQLLKKGVQKQPTGEEKDAKDTEKLPIGEEKAANDTAKQPTGEEKSTKDTAKQPTREEKFTKDTAKDKEKPPPSEQLKEKQLHSDEKLSKDSSKQPDHDVKTLKGKRKEKGKEDIPAEAHIEGHYAEHKVHTDKPEKHIVKEKAATTISNVKVTKYDEPETVRDELLRQEEKLKVELEAGDSLETIYPDEEIKVVPKTKKAKKQKKPQRSKIVAVVEKAAAVVEAKALKALKKKRRSKRKPSVESERRTYSSSTYSVPVLRRPNTNGWIQKPPEHDDAEWSRKKLAQMRIQAELEGSDDKRDSASTFAEFSVASNRRLFNEKYGGIERAINRSSWHRKRLEKEKEKGEGKKRSSPPMTRRRSTQSMKRASADEMKRKKRMSEEIKAARQRYEALRNAKTPRLDSIDDAQGLASLPLQAISVHGLLQNPNLVAKISQRDLKGVLSDAAATYLEENALRRQLSAGHKDEKSDNTTKLDETRAPMTQRHRRGSRTLHQEDSIDEWVAPEDYDTDVFANLTSSKILIHQQKMGYHTDEIPIYDRPSIRSQMNALEDESTESDTVKISTLMQVRRSRLDSYNRMVNANIKRSSSHPQYLGKGKWEVKRKRKRSTDLTACGMPCCQPATKEECCKFIPKLRKPSSSISSDDAADE